ncbi:hypothetical protein ACIBJI_23985 [Nocardia sp. NPDC050408]|uniref:hypothetical protein n=1 Tax=Nocardia sp. NPDC050408 TaxID=3364319 RepID=UPI0037A407B9
MQEKSRRTRLSMIAGALAGALLIVGAVAATELGQATPAPADAHTVTTDHPITTWWRPADVPTHVIEAASGPSNRGAGH